VREDSQHALLAFFGYSPYCSLIFCLGLDWWCVRVARLLAGFI
jgi:hypothetical protein